MADILDGHALPQFQGLALERTGGMLLRLGEGQGHLAGHAAAV